MHEGHEIVRGEKKPRKLTAAQIRKFVAIVGKENVDRDTYSRLKHSMGKSMEEEFNLRKGIIDCITLIVSSG